MFVSFEGRRNRQPIWMILKPSCAIISPGFIVQHPTFWVSILPALEAFASILNLILRPSLSCSRYPCDPQHDLCPANAIGEALCPRLGCDYFTTPKRTYHASAKD